MRSNPRSAIASSLWQPEEPRSNEKTRSFLRMGSTTAKVLVDPDAVTGDVSITLPGPYLVDGSIASLRHDTPDLAGLRHDRQAAHRRHLAGRHPSRVRTSSTTALFADSTGRASRSAASRSGATSLDALTAEFERARRYGFDAGEVDQMLRSYRSGLQAEFDGSGSVQDTDYISRYVDHFLSGQPIPDADTAFQVYGSIYDEVTPDAVGSAFNELLGAAAAYVMVVAPHSLADVPTEDDVMARLAALPSIDLDAREATTAGATELMAAPNPVAETETDSLDSDDMFVAPTMLTFANGARVVLNPTDIASNDIYFAGTSPGGLSLVADADVPEALNAAAVVTASGLGDLDPVAFGNSCPTRRSRCTHRSARPARTFPDHRRPTTSSCCSRWSTSTSPTPLRSGGARLDGRAPCSRTSMIRTPILISPSTSPTPRPGTEPRRGTR